MTKNIVDTWELSEPDQEGGLTFMPTHENPFCALKSDIEGLRIIPNEGLKNLINALKQMAAAWDKVKMEANDFTKAPDFFERYYNLIRVLLECATTYRDSFGDEAARVVRAVLASGLTEEFSLQDNYADKHIITTRKKYRLTTLDSPILEHLVNFYRLGFSSFMHNEMVREAGKNQRAFLEFIRGIFDGKTRELFALCCCLPDKEELLYPETGGDILTRPETGGDILTHPETGVDFWEGGLSLYSDVPEQSRRRVPLLEMHDCIVRASRLPGYIRIGLIGGTEDDAKRLEGLCASIEGKNVDVKHIGIGEMTGSTDRNVLIIADAGCLYGKNEAAEDPFLPGNGINLVTETYRSDMRGNRLDERVVRRGTLASVYENLLAFGCTGRLGIIRGKANNQTVMRAADFCLTEGRAHRAVFAFYSYVYTAEQMKELSGQIKGVKATRRDFHRHTAVHLEKDMTGIEKTATPPVGSTGLFIFTLHDFLLAFIPDLRAYLYVVSELLDLPSPQRSDAGVDAVDIVGFTDGKEAASLIGYAGRVFLAMDYGDWKRDIKFFYQAKPDVAAPFKLAVGAEQALEKMFMLMFTFRDNLFSDSVTEAFDRLALARSATVGDCLFHNLYKMNLHRYKSENRLAQIRPSEKLSGYYDPNCRFSRFTTATAAYHDAIRVLDGAKGYYYRLETLVERFANAGITETEAYKNLGAACERLRYTNSALYDNCMHRLERMAQGKD